MEIIWYDENITKAQVETYAAIKEYIDMYKYSPSIRDLCKIRGKSSPATMLYELRILKKKGYIDFAENKSRTIRILKEVKYGKY